MAGEHGEVNSEKLNLGLKSCQKYRITGILKKVMNWKMYRMLIMQESSGLDYRINCFQCWKREVDVENTPHNKQKCNGITYRQWPG